MRQNVITAVKNEIDQLLQDYLQGEPQSARVTVEAVEDRPVEGTLLLCEIRVVLGILGKPWQCDALVNGIYEALQAHHLTQGELRVVLMSLHVEIRSMALTRVSKRATIRYVLEHCEEEKASSSTLPASA